MSHDLQKIEKTLKVSSTCTYHLLLLVAHSLSLSHIFHQYAYTTEHEALIKISSDTNKEV